MIKTVFQFFRPAKRTRADQYMAGQSIQMPPWSRRRRRIAIIKRLTRIICLLLVGMAAALFAASGFADTASAAPPHNVTGDRDEVLDAGLAALKRGNFNAAILHFQPLANDNDPSAQFALAMIHSGGFGNRQDKSYNPDRAHQLMAQAAALGHREAQFQLGLQFIRGVGVPVNLRQAHLCLSVAAHRRHVRAQIYLAVILERLAATSMMPPAKKTLFRTDAYKWTLIALQTAATSDIQPVDEQKLRQIASTLRAALSYSQLQRATAAARMFTGTPI